MFIIDGTEPELVRLVTEAARNGTMDCLKYLPPILVIQMIKFKQKRSDGDDIVRHFCVFICGSLEWVKQPPERM